MSAVHCSGAEDEPAPNQYNYNKGKETCMNKSPSYTIQQGRRGGAVFWMARGQPKFLTVCLCCS